MNHQVEIMATVIFCIVFLGLFPLRDIVCHNVMSCIDALETQMHEKHVESLTQSQTSHRRRLIQDDGV